MVQHPQPRSLLPEMITSITSSAANTAALLTLSWPAEYYYDITRLLTESGVNAKVLAAWQLHHNDFRGAAAALVPSLQAAQSRATQGVSAGRRNKEEKVLDRDYLAVINLLSCVGEENAWILAGPSPAAKRQIVTLDDIRDAWKSETERRNVIAKGQFALVATDAMDLG